MIRVIDAHEVVMGKVRYYEFAGTANDIESLPFWDDIATGSIFIVVGTGIVLFYDEENKAWINPATGDAVTPEEDTITMPPGGLDDEGGGSEK